MNGKTLVLTALVALTALTAHAKDTLDVRKVSEWGNFFDQTQFEAYQDGYLYLLTSSSILIVDASNATDLRPLGHYDAPLWSMNFPNFYPCGSVGYFYDAWYTNDPFSIPIEVVDLSNPSSPRQIASIPAPFAARSMAAYQDYLYIQDRQHGLRLIDMSDPSQPNDLGRLFPDSSFNNVLVHGSLGFFGTRLYDLTDPVNPRWLGRCSNPPSVFFGDTMGVARKRYRNDMNQDTLVIMDISDPTAIAIRDTLLVNHANGLIGAGNFLIVDEDQGDADSLVVYDLSDSTGVRQVGSKNVESWTWIASGSDETIYTNDFSGFDAFSFREEEGFVQLDSLKGNGYVSSAAKIGDTAYLACGIAGIKMLDVSDIEAPAEVGTLNEMTYVRKVLSRGNLLFVNSGERSDSAAITIFYCTERQRPEWLATVTLGDYVSSWTLPGDFLWVTLFRNLLVLDVSDPHNPTQVCKRPYDDFLPTDFGEMSVGDERTYFALSSSQSDTLDSCAVLAILPNDNPTADPVLIYRSPPERGLSIATEGNVLYLLTQIKGESWWYIPKLTAFDISNPDHPVELFSDTTNLDSLSSSVSIQQGHLFVHYGGYGRGRNMGVDVWDVADPMNRRLLGYTPFVGKLEGSISYVASGVSFQIWDFEALLKAPTSDLPLTPYALFLAPPYPNPFNSTTTISFGLSKLAPTRLAVFDIQGRLVQELWTGRDAYPTGSRQAGRLSYAGEHKVVWDASGVGAGVYLIRLESGGKTAAVKALVVK